MMPLVLFGGLNPQDIPFPIRDNKEHQKIFTFNELESVGGGFLPVFPQFLQIIAC